MGKSAEAFRTISEVADLLDVPKHVLRFWEAKFPQIRPMKRGGGRRYYRPEDMALLCGIRHLLHAQGYTIKGVQKILRERGVEQVKSEGARDPATADVASGGATATKAAAAKPSGAKSEGAKSAAAKKRTVGAKLPDQLDETTADMRMRGQARGAVAPQTPPQRDADGETAHRVRPLQRARSSASKDEAKAQRRGLLENAVAELEACRLALVQAGAETTRQPDAAARVQRQRGAR